MIIKNTFLTPSSLWEGFDDGLPLKETVVNKIKVESAIMTELYFSGRAVGSERVRIYGFYSVPESGVSKGAILYLSGENEKIGFASLQELVATGYSVLTVDLYGERDELKNHTEYPSSIEYANLLQVGRHKDFVDESARETCWYEWTSVARYAVSFLKSKGYEKIAVVGDKTGANVGWQLAAFDHRLSCFVALFGAGWTAYKNEYKYASEFDESEKDESFRKYVAAVDAHAYAQYVRCPVLFLTSTNGDFMEFDRAGDTLSRMNEEVPCYYNFSAGYNAHLDDLSKNDLFAFLKKYIGIGGKMPINPELAVTEENGKLKFTATADGCEKISGVTLFVNDGVIESPYRNWKKYGMTPDKKSVFSADYSPEADKTFAFCIVEYENGLALASKEVIRRSENTNKFVHRLIYSGRNGLNGLCFSDEPDGKVFLKRTIELKSGANDILGAYSPDGLISYAFLENDFALGDNSLLKFDVCADEYCVVKFSLYELDINGDLKEYSFTGEFKAEGVWQNTIVKITDFKSESGLTIKNYGGIIALGIKSEARYILNNVLIV